MNELFNRHIVCSIYDPNDSGKRFEHFIPDNKDFSIDFESQFARGKATVSTVKLYNVRHSTIALCDPKGTGKNMRYASVELSAGYGDNLSLVLTGNIIQKKYLRQGPDSVLELKISGGTQKLLHTFISATYKSQIASNLLKTILSQNKIPFAPIQFKSDPLIEQISFHTTLENVLNELSKQAKFTYDMRLGKLAIEQKDSPKKQPQMIPRISRKTGMVGVPERDGIFWKVKSLLTPAIVTGGLVRLESLEIKTSEGNTLNTEVEIEKGKHSGSSKGQNFYTEFWGKPK